MTTIRDVAKRAGVSVATVSHVLNGTRVVLPQTRESVLSAIKDLQYRPSAVARGLTTQRTKTIGVIIADVTSPFFSFLLKQLESQLSVAGYNILVCNTFEQPDIEARNLELLLDKRVDGLVLTSTGFAQPMYAQFEAHGIPMVFIERKPPGTHASFVGTDNQKACYEAARYLIGLGHRRIGLLSLDQETSVVVARNIGFRQALEEAGIYDDRLRVATAMNTESAREVTKSLLAFVDSPTALIAGSHIATLGALKALHDLGLRYPADVSLVCFENSLWTDVIQPTLTVVTKPIDALAASAARTLLDSLDAIEKARKYAASPQTLPVTDLLLEPQFVLRESCRPPKSS